jgi:hypothetical protein
MKLQIWRIEELENILWGIHAVMVATMTALNSDGVTLSEDYSRGFQKGFETALQRVTLSLNEALLPQSIAFQQDLEVALRTVQTVMLATMAGSNDNNQVADHRRGFNQGFETALWCVATALGVSLSSGLDRVWMAAGAVVGHNQHWFHEDLNRILQAFQLVLQATFIAAQAQTRPADYHQGFEYGLGCVAKSLGVRLLLPRSETQLRQAASSSHVYFRFHQDIENNLLTIHRLRQENLITQANSSRSTDYNNGFETALQCLAHTFGIRLSSPKETDLPQFEQG